MISSLDGIVSKHRFLSQSYATPRVLSWGFWVFLVGFTILLVRPLDRFARARDVSRQALLFRLAAAMEGCAAKNSLSNGEGYTSPHDCGTLGGLVEAGLIKEPELEVQLGENWTCAPGCVSVKLERPDDPAFPYWKYKGDSGGRGEPAAEPCEGRC